jgi:hypothetical protein
VNAHFKDERYLLNMKPQINNQDKFKDGNIRLVEGNNAYEGVSDIINYL